MKLITAVIRPSRLKKVSNALEAAGLTGLTATEVQGRGAQGGRTEYYRGEAHAIEFRDKVRLEALVTDENADATIEAIVAGLEPAEAEGLIADWKSDRADADADAGADADGGDGQLLGHLLSKGCGDHLQHHGEGAGLGDRAFARIELDLDNRLRDLVGDGYDLAVRFGHGLMWAGLPVIHEFMSNRCSFMLIHRRVRR